MGKQPDAKRRARLKERRKKAEATLARAFAAQSKVSEWSSAHDTEPNIIVELVDENGAALAHIEGDDDDMWTVVVNYDPVISVDDEFIALGLFLSAAVDEKAAGDTSWIQFGTWLIEEIERRCETANMNWEDFLRSLLPLEKRYMALPQQRML